MNKGRYGSILATTQLNKLFHLLHIECEDTRIIQGISDDTRWLKKDWIYVCWNVTNLQQTQFIKEALRIGAVVLCEKKVEMPNVYTVKSIEAISQVLIELYYGNLCEHLTVIGITGTNGKTSVAAYLEQVMNLCGKRMMRIGTKEVRYLDQKQTIANTTPERFLLAHLFHLAQSLSLDGIVMEVSSHAIDANRICFIQFDIIIYTNITQDHLDYHITKTHYRFTKFKLRRYLKENGIIIYNKDLKEMRELPMLYQGPCLTIGCKDAHLLIHDIALSDHDSSFSIEQQMFHVSLLGMINVYNMTSVIAAARRLSIPLEQLKTVCEKVKGVAGRMEVIEGFGYHIWIDFAHTPDALFQLLEFAKQVATGRVITIVGCGGDRDQKKRAIMGDIVAYYSDIAIFTADNPRGEAVHHILSDMITFPKPHVEIFENRYFAIKHAVKYAQNSDIIIIAGKGSETSQIVNGHSYPFSDRDIVYKRLCEEENHWK